MEKLKPQKASQSACLMETIKPRFYRRFSVKSYFLSLSHQGVKHDYRMELSGTLYALFQTSKRKISSRRPLRLKHQTGAC